MESMVLITNNLIYSEIIVAVFCLLNR